jgi:hypothetical protein
LLSTLPSARDCYPLPHPTTKSSQDMAPYSTVSQKTVDFPLRKSQEREQVPPPFSLPLLSLLSLSLSLRPLPLTSCSSTTIFEVYQLAEALELMVQQEHQSEGKRCRSLSVRNCVGICVVYLYIVVRA